MKGNRTITFIICALMLLVSAFALFGCTKEETKLLSTSDLSAWNKVTEKNAMNGEWVSFRKDRPTLVVFHGKTEEDKVSFNLPISVYESAAYADEKVNATTIGMRGQGLKTNERGEYDLTGYWTNAAKFNVFIVHTEKFFREAESDIVTKLFSTYKSRFVDGGSNVDCDFGVAFTDVLTAFVAETLMERSLTGEEIRFVGYGSGADAALAVAYRLYRGQEGKDGTLYYGVYPSRVTLCDPYTSNEQLTFTPSVDGLENASSAAEAVASMTAFLYEKTPVVTELIETQEVTDSGVSYAYATNVRSGETYQKILRNSVSLLFAESYSTKTEYASYREKKRVAFDWYLYSVIGSDDSFTYEKVDQKLSIGYPHTYYDYMNNNGNGTRNWDDNARRPMMNDRKRTNDGTGDEEIAGRCGINFSLSAWTPTEYMRGLIGYRFTQKEGTTKTGTDVHGNDVYEYTDYVLTSFKSENYQVSDLTEGTVVTCRVYVDANGDGKINDGEKSAITSRLYLTVEYNDGTVLVPRTAVYTDEFGVFTILIEDKKGEEAVTLSATTGRGTITGFSALDDSLILRFELYCPKGYTAKSAATKGIWYNKVSRNNFDKTSDLLDVSAFNAHAVIVANALIQKEAE